MKLVILASRFPYPLEKGDKLRLYYQIRDLSAQFDIYLFALSDVRVSDADKQALQAHCSEIHVYSINGKINLLKNAMSSRPFQVSYFYNASIHQKITKQVSRIQPDHIYYQLLRMYPYSFPATAASVSIDLMDSFSVGYLLRSQQESGFLSILYNKETQRLIAYEKKIIEELDCKFIISEQDKVSLVPIEDNEMHIIANGIDTQFFAPEEHSKIRDILFVGNMGYKPNIYATEFLVDKILPLLQEREQGITLTIAGARPTSKILAYKNKHIKVTGWVEDIRDVYNTHRLFVAPIFSGIGQQNKILEAMAMEIPCVVSPEVAKGLDIGNIQEYLFVAENAMEFADAIIEVLAGNTDAETRVIRAKKYVLENRSWKAQNRKLSKKIMDKIHKYN